MLCGALRIALLSVHTSPLATLGGKKTGGMNVYVKELARELGRRGLCVDIFTRRDSPDLPTVEQGALGPRVRVHYIAAGPARPMIPTQIYEHLDEFAEGILAVARQDNIVYDLIHSHYWLSGIVALRLKETMSIPVIQMFHTLGQMKNRIALSSAEMEPPLRIESESHIMQEVDFLVAATPAERIQMMWLYNAPMQKIQIIPPGVDLQHFCPIPRDEARQLIEVLDGHKMVLFVGRLEPLKGVDTLLRAMALLRDQSLIDPGKVNLAIIGGGGGSEDRELERLQGLCLELSLGNFVAFLGAKEQQTLPGYYAAAEFVVMPSHYESFGMVALEAMACGTPVIASEVGGLAYLVQDGVTGFHVPDQEPDELAGKMGLLLHNEKLRGEMSASAVIRAQQYGWSQVATQIQQLYAKAVA